MKWTQVYISDERLVMCTLYKNTKHSPPPPTCANGVTYGVYLTFRKCSAHFLFEKQILQNRVKVSARSPGYGIMICLCRLVGVCLCMYVCRMLGDQHTLAAHTHNNIRTPQPSDNFTWPLHRASCWASNSC